MTAMEDSGDVAEVKSELRQRVSDGNNGAHILEDRIQQKTTDVECSVGEGLTMERTVGLVSGVSLIVGTIIGSGIFISPKGVLVDTGSVGLSLVVWAASGLISLLGALCYAELGTLIRLSGGDYAFIKKALGNVFGYLYAWTAVVVMRPSSVSIVCLVFAEYASSVLEMCGQPETPKKLIGVIAMITVGVVNSWSTKLASRVIVVFTVAKVIALVIIVIGGLVKIAQGNTSTLAKGFEGSTTNFSTIALAFYGALWAYDGWNHLTLVTEEIVHPKRNVFRANVIGVMIVTIIYILTNIGYLAVLTTDELVQSSAVAVTWGNLILGGAAIIMPLSVMISTFGATNGTIFGGVRVVYAAGRDNNLPEVLSFIQVNQRTPLPSVIFSMFLAVLMIIPGNIGSLIDFFSFTAWVFYGMTFLSLLILRYKMKDVERPYKVPIPIPVIMLAVSVYLVIAPIVDSPQIEFLYAFLFILGGLIFYFPFVFFNKKLPGWDGFTKYCQLVLNIVPSAVAHDD